MNVLYFRLEEKLFLEFFSRFIYVFILLVINKLCVYFIKGKNK